ncbi:fatty acid desaturase family protein [Hyphomicrobium sp.]|uniref:fatty acid desaturase family protein n=1 Tax=Hyphomicrobium sp. TaxID=82 RepID=UPI002E3357DF|nr:fatty acid desaturase [Hyphomicrobium sp.]HEX2843375.1 fatty acid desaturase [Hyphomicrobium sp.]
MLNVAGTWVGILATVLIAAYVNDWPMIPVGMALLVGLQHRLFTLYHEGFHGCLVQDGKLGNRLARFFAAYPSLSRYDGARQRHLDHHSRATSTDDPERVSHCENWRELAPLMFPIPWALSRSILGWAPFEAEFQRVLADRDNSPYPFAPGERVAITTTMLAIIVGLAGLCWAVGGSPLWALLYPVTLILFTNPIMVLRQWVEHYNEDDHSVDPRYFYVRSNVVERFFFSPMNFNFHGAHHHYPWIPYYNLPTLHAELVERGAGINERSSYLSMLTQLSLQSERKPA